MTLIINGDCLEELRAMPDNSVDAVITDPPYGLSNTTPTQVAETIAAWVNGDREHVPAVKGGFMGAAWDSFVPPPAVWDEVYRVLKPGGHMAVFAGTRTQDLMGIGIRLAGFDIRDSIAWIYGSGMPKSLNVSKAIEKAAGSEGTDEAKRWEGWGTATKPAHEPVIIARKPLSERTVAANVLTWGTGAINVDATRITHASPEDLATSQAKNPGRTDTVTSDVYGANRPQQTVNAQGRFPANVVLDRANADRLDQQSGTLKSGGRSKEPGDVMRSNWRSNEGREGEVVRATGYERSADEGGASRFFHVAENLAALDAPFKYCAKAPKKERPSYVDDGGRTIQHPTTKPLSIMSWLCKLLVPPGGTVLDPFAGSGTTLLAARALGHPAVGIELSPSYCDAMATALR